MEFKTLIKEPFCVIGKEIFTWDGDGMIPNPNTESNNLIRADVIAWSAGPDGDYSTWKDNVGSWE